MTQTSQDLASLPCSLLAGIGAKLSEKLAKRSLYTLQDLLFHLPYRYQDRTRITPIANCLIGQHVVVEGNIIQTQVNTRGKLQLQCILADASSKLSIRFFHFNAAQKQQLKVGTRLRCFGEIRYARQGIEMVHPEYQVVSPTGLLVVEETLRPVYPTTEGLSQQSLFKLTSQALHFLNNGHLLTELMPAQLLNRLQLPDLKTAITYLHRPPPDALLTQLEEGAHPCQARLIFEELTAHQLSMRRLRQTVQKEQAPALKQTGQYTDALLKGLPFQLTGAQQRVCQEILSDIAQAYPMMRLVQGDVGSGKTVVAAYSLLTAVEAGFQVALMAPTEILAEQHYKNLTAWLSPLGITVTWLAGKTKGKARKEALAQIADGSGQIIIGTHALLQEDVSFKKLALLVIDEQHRFGVHQRLALRAKGEDAHQVPHQLIMTATPIPRTLAMSCYADLDMSIIDELPPGRTPVTTVAISNERRDEVIERVALACAQGKQVYWVCTLIDDSEVLTCQAAEETAASLQQALPHINVQLVHGRMKSAEKEAVMTAFKAGQAQLLVATTVIEVGVDVANASLMIIENPERLGLAQLHQLRGRVGRGSAQSHCVLLYQLPLSEHARKRIAIMRETSDGFQIAQKDLELRGPGELLGTRQTGIVQFKVADILRDKHWLNQAQQAADWILMHHPAIVEPLIQRWLGDNEQYANA